MMTSNVSPAPTTVMRIFVRKLESGAIDVMITEIPKKTSRWWFFQEFRKALVCCRFRGAGAAAKHQSSTEEASVVDEESGLGKGSGSDLGPGFTRGTPRLDGETSSLYVYSLMAFGWKVKYSNTKTQKNHRLTERYYYIFGCSLKVNIADKGSTD